MGDENEDEVAQEGGFEVDIDLTAGEFAPGAFTPIVQQKRMGIDSEAGIVSEEKTSSVLVENLLSQNTGFVSSGFSATHIPSDLDNIQSSSQMIADAETDSDIQGGPRKSASMRRSASPIQPTYAAKVRGSSESKIKS